MDILSRVAGALQSPGVRGAATGILGAAALGANPLLGLIAAPALANASRRAETQQTAAELELEERAQRITARRRQQEAIDSLPGILGAATVPDALVGPPRPGEMRATDQRMGLLSAVANIAPQAAASGILAQLNPRQERALPADLRTMEALGFPATPEGYAAFKSIGSEGNGLDDTLTRLRIEEALQGLERNARETQAEDAAEAEARGLRGSSARAVADEAIRVADLLDELDGTNMRPGTDETFRGVLRAGRGVAGSVLDTLGLDDAAEDMRGPAATSDTLAKSVAALSNAGVDSLVGEGATNRQREEAARSLPSMSMEPEAIRASTKMLLDRLIREAQITNIPQSDLERLREARSKIGGKSVVNVEVTP